jgi:putative addiction module component (TIGR02574 family)
MMMDFFFIGVIREIRGRLLHWKLLSASSDSTVMDGLIEIGKLTPEEKLQLMGKLWESFVDDPDSLPIRAEEKQELERRSHEHRLNPGSALS